MNTAPKIDVDSIAQEALNAATEIAADANRAPSLEDLKAVTSTRALSIVSEQPFAGATTSTDGNDDNLASLTLKTIDTRLRALFEQLAKADTVLIKTNRDLIGAGSSLPAPATANSASLLGRIGSALDSLDKLAAHLNAQADQLSKTVG